MIRYHGGPIWPTAVAAAVWPTRHGLISYAHADQVELAAEVCQSFCIDNGAFSIWMKSVTPGKEITWDGYQTFLEHWSRHPGFDFCLIPDVIDGTTLDNDRLLAEWPFPDFISVPVWHMHEEPKRLEHLVDRYPRVAIGSSGEYSTLQSDKWWARMCEAMECACDQDGIPKAKLHGLRMMSPTIFSHVPFSSVDSASVAVNHGLTEAKWSGPYRPLSGMARAIVLADRCERHACATRWSGSKGLQMNLELVG
jgi:hypothetical protein